MLMDNILKQVWERERLEEESFGRGQVWEEESWEDMKGENWKPKVLEGVGMGGRGLDRLGVGGIGVEV